VLSEIKAITEVSQSKMTAFFFFLIQTDMTPSAVLLTTCATKHAAGPELILG